MAEPWEGLTATLIDQVDEETKKGDIPRLNDKSIQDLKLLKAKLVLNMDHPDAYEYAGMGKQTSRAGRSVEVCRRMKVLRPVVIQWLEEKGLTKEGILAEWLEDIHAEETKFFQHEGVVTDERNVINYAARQNALVNIGKIQGVYAPEKHEHTGKGGKDLNLMSPAVEALLLKSLSRKTS